VNYLDLGRMLGLYEVIMWWIGCWMVIFGLMIFLFALIWMLNIVSSYVYIVLLACGLIGRIFKINKKSRIILKKSRIIKKMWRFYICGQLWQMWKVTLLHMWKCYLRCKKSNFYIWRKSVINLRVIESWSLFTTVSVRCKKCFLH
jgi:hypothetical protein